MKKLAVQLIKELTSLADTIPTGFKGFFAKTTGLHFKDSSAIEHKLVSTNNKYKSTDFEKAILTNTVLWPNCYDATRPSIKNAILNSGDVLVNLIELGGTVIYSTGIGTIQAVHVAGQAGVIANETNRTQYLDGGSGYTVGDVLTLLSGDSNATVTVASVDGNGKVITVTLTAAGTNYKTNASCSVSGGTGSGCKIYIAYVNGSARNPAGANYINKVFQSEGQAQSSGGNLYWTNVSPTNPVEILITMPVVTKSIHQLLLVPGGRNRHPFNYKVETTSAETAYYGGQNRWHQALNVTTETDTYVKLINTLASEQIKYIRITIYEAGDSDLVNSFALGYLIGYQRYIGDGRFTGYSISASGDTVFGDYIFRGTNYKTDNTKEIKILPETKQVVVGGVSLASGTEIINFDASIEPTQSGTVSKTTLWMFQYLAQAVKWLKANYSINTHSHNFDTLNNIPTADAICINKNSTTTLTLTAATPIILEFDICTLSLFGLSYSSGEINVSNIGIYQIVYSVYFSTSSVNIKLSGCIELVEDVNVVDTGGYGKIYLMSGATDPKSLNGSMIVKTSTANSKLRCVIESDVSCTVDFIMGSLTVHKIN